MFNITGLTIYIFSMSVLCVNGNFRENLTSTSNSDKQQSSVPLILTSFIDEGKIQEAQNACKVPPLKGNITSYAGFFNVNKKCNSNMFFWFIPALHESETAPVILWLQGGPGISSLFGLFYLNGPFTLSKTLELKLREDSWTNSHSVLYIDNPVGAGFSFTKKTCGYSKNEVQIGNNLYRALLQFFKLFPRFQKNDFYIMGESYAGKYVPAATYTIHKKNPTAHLKINLKGMAIGNGLCDPENMLNYGDYLYQIGLIDSIGRDLFHKKEKQIVSYIRQKKWLAAFSGFDSLILGDFAQSTLFRNLTGFKYLYNYLQTSKDINRQELVEFLSRSNIRNYIHVGKTDYIISNEVVERYLLRDFMQSVKPWIEIILEHYKVLVYSGQLDIIIAHPLTDAFVDKLEWSGANTYRRTPRKKWYVGEDLAGYSKVVGNLAVVLVRNASHLVPRDQPKWGIDLITRFTRNKKF